MDTLPAWLIRRIRLGIFSRAFTLLAPASPTSAAIYLLESSRDADGGPPPLYELHAVTNAQSGIEGATIPLSRAELCDVLLTFAGVLSGRIEPEAESVSAAAPADPVIAP